MIELLKYLCTILKTDELLEVSHIIGKHPEIIDEETLMEIMYHVKKYEEDCDTDTILGYSDEIEKHFKKLDNAADNKEEIKQNSAIYDLLKDSNIGLN